MVSSGEQGEGGEVIVTVNVGGVRQLLPSELLCRFPETRLGRLCLLRCSPGAPVLGAAPELALDLCDDFDPRSGEFYFDRDPRSFDAVLDLYYVGEIHMERGVCPICFKNEMDFWQVDVDYLDDCCRGLFSEKLEELEEVARRVQLVLDDQAGAGEGDHWKRFQKTLWKLMEKPETSAQARMLAIASFLVVVVSAVTMCLGTIPELQVKSETGQLVEHPTVTIIETVCIMWFTLEYVLRLISAPQTLHFVFSFMNIIDMLAILPYYLAMFLSGMGDAILELNNVQQAVQALRIMRIVRVFKLARHSSGLQTLTYALKSSFKELSLLLLYLAMGIFLFSALGYTLEQSHPETMFTSIPHSFWWAIITMTTVGYGDIFPKTGLGKLNAAASFLCGILAIALPIHPIINNFVKYYNKQKVLDTAVKHQLERLATGALHAWHGAIVPAVAAETRPQECTFRDSGAGLKRHIS